VVRLDAGGRRPDPPIAASQPPPGFRRGFSETRVSTRCLAIGESNEHRAHGRSNADLLGMSPEAGIGKMQLVDRTTLTVAPDGQSFWSWCLIDRDVCFGIAARDCERRLRCRPT
jgi:hypothetical protein